MRFIICLLLATTIAAAERPVTAADAKETFAHLKSFAGTWKAKSTKGWTETNTFDVAGKGSVVINRSHFDDEPNDGMVSTFYLDGDRLLLTHYCEAGNQPTLIAKTIDDAAHRITFDFLSGTNLSVKPGHMHGVTFQFVDDDHFRSHWSFYREGKESWFEEIENVRVNALPQRR
jgi:hypothetical protein